MNKLDLKLENLIRAELEKVQRLKPFVENVEISYEQQKGGVYFTRLKAKTRRKTINLLQEGRCATRSIKKVFSNLKRVLEKKSTRSKRLTFDLREAA